MNFEDILKDIENYLIGKELNSINPATPSFFVTEIDYDEKKYYVSSSEKNRGKARSFNELIEIWNELERKGFSSVDQALYGSGSSRNQPETVFSNLPYIQHFKYKNKKHILLRSHNVHDAGTLCELQGSEFRKIRKQVDNYLNLSLRDISLQQSSIIYSLRDSLDSVLKKYPGESVIQNTEHIFSTLENINGKISESIVSLDSDIKININKSQDNTYEEFRSIEEKIESSQYTGVEDNITQEESDLDMDHESKLSVSNNGTKIRQSTPVLSLIYDRLEFGEIELQPDFQRKDRIWKNDKKVKLIESILMGLPLPAFYFAEKKDGTWIIVDGLQRITSVYDYMKGLYPLNNLDVLGSEYDNKYFKDLTRREQRFIREYAVTAYVIDITTDTSNMVVELFHRINTYGVKLSDQEIRSALNKGSSTLFLRYVSSLSDFKIATHEKVKAERQKDMELCLSALSFMILGYNSFGTSTYSNYLSSTLTFMNKFKLTINNHEKIEDGKAEISIDSHVFYLDLLERFKKGLNIAYKTFGEICFLKEPNPKKTSPISKSLFEVIVSYFSMLTPIQEEKLFEKSSDFIECLYEAIENDEHHFAKWESDTYNELNRGFMYSISTSTGKKVTVRYRFEAFHEILKKSTGIDVKFISLKDEQYASY